MISAVMHTADAAGTATGTCKPPAKLSAVLEPFTTLFACPENEFWDYRMEQCAQCEDTDDPIPCGDGRYVPGCDALARMSNNGDEACRDCTYSLEASEQWLPGAVCVAVCIPNFYRTNISDACLPCTARMPPGYCPAGLKAHDCTHDQDQHCAECPVIDKSIYSRNEEFVDDVDRDCATACKDNSYRHSTPQTLAHDVSFYCIECTAPALFIAESSPDIFLQFSACGAETDTVASECPVRSSSIVVGHAPAANTPCLYQCAVGAHRVHFNASDPNASEVLCAACSALLDRNGSVVPRDAYQVTSLECDFVCHAPYHAYNGTCWRCHRDRCPTAGTYLRNCSECHECTSAGAHSTFSGSGAWDADSCPFECDSGFWDDFGRCSAHTAYAVLAASCPPDTHIRNGTATLDAMCMPCKRCEGLKQTRNCSLAYNSECGECAHLVLDTFVGTRCAQQCRPGRVHFGDGACEQCTHTCPPGRHFTPTRTSCKDCRNCSNALPTSHVWVSGCVSRAMNTPQGGQGMIAAAAILLPYCKPTEYLLTLENGAVCVSCAEFPDATRPPAAPVGLERTATWAWAKNGQKCAWQCVPGLTRFAGATPGSLRCAWDTAAATAANAAELATKDVETVPAAHINHTHTTVVDSIGTSMVVTVFGIIAVALVLVSCLF